MTRKYSSISVETTLASSLGATGTSMVVATGTASSLLGGVTLAAGNVDIFTVALDPDTTNEEIVYITANSGDTFSITRAQAGTTAVSHSAGATVQHVLSSADLNTFESTSQNAVTLNGTQTITNKTINASNNTFVGVATLSGTQTLTNKDLTSTSNTFPTTVVTTSGSQTLTNKTLTSPTVDDPKLNLTVNAQTGTTYTFVLADNGKFITASNASAQTYTIPTNASVAFPIGAQVHIIQIGAGQVTIQGAAGVTVASTGATSTAPKILKQYAAATCIKTGTDTWYVIGSLQ